MRKPVNNILIFHVWPESDRNCGIIRYVTLKRCENVAFTARCCVCVFVYRRFIHRTAPVHMNAVTRDKYINPSYSEEGQSPTAAVRNNHNGIVSSLSGAFIRRLGLFQSHETQSVFEFGLRCLYPLFITDARKDQGHGVCNVE